MLAPTPTVVLVLVEVEAEGASVVAAKIQDVSVAAIRPLEDIDVEDLIIG